MSCLTNTLSYAQLVRDKMVPSFQLSTLPNKRFPKAVYEEMKVRKDVLEHMNRNCSEIIVTGCAASETISQWVKDNYSSFVGISAMYQEVEYKGVKVISELCALDGSWIMCVRCSTTFKKEFENVILEQLAISCVMKKMGYPCDNIGICLPVQKQLLWYSVKNWNCDLFFHRLQLEVEWIKGDKEIMYKRLISHYCGAHVSKSKVVEISHESNGRPLQVFIGSPKSLGPVSVKGLNGINTKFFVHASYLINMCTIGQDIIRLIDEVESTRSIGGKGVVFHVGKYTVNDHDQCLIVKERQIKDAMYHATAECPLILETPAGEGTEMCASLESMMDFYSRFNGDKRFKICVDSAHVHALGYDPAWYLHQWLTRWPDSVALVHFNDSTKCRGSRVDEHDMPGLGHIGYDRMQRLHDLCVGYGVPMVRE